MKENALQEDDGPVDGDTQSCSSESAAGNDIDYDDEYVAKEGSIDNYQGDALTKEYEIIEKHYTSQQNRNEKKRVHFETGTDGEIVCRKYKNFNPSSSSERKKICYRRRDFKRFRKESRQIVGIALKSPFMADFHKVYDACSSAEKLSALTQQCATAVSESEYRGYEAVIFFDTLNAERKSVLTQILQAQQQYVSCNIMTFDERADALGKLYRALSKKARRLAHVLGSGDAVVARNTVSQQELDEIESYKFMKWTPLPKFSDSLANFEGSYLCEI